MIDIKILDFNNEHDVQGTLRMLTTATKSSKALSMKTLDWFFWKFGQSPFGEAVVAIAATPQEQVAGVVAFGLYELTQGNENIKAALSYETFVHPEFRRMGLFSRLIAAGVQECERRGVQVLFNFPNSSSLPGFVKKGWLEAGAPRLFMKPVQWRRLLTNFQWGIRKAAFKPDRIQTFSPEDYHGFADRLTEMRSIRSEQSWAARRTPAYMIWRYQTYPLYRYVVVSHEMGWAIVRTGSRGSYQEAQVLDWFPQTSFSRAFVKAISGQIARQLEPDLISVALSKAHPAYSLLWRTGFLPIPSRANFTYFLLDERLKSEKRDWILTATEFHTY